MCNFDNFNNLNDNFFLQLNDFRPSTIKIKKNSNPSNCCI